MLQIVMPVQWKGKMPNFTGRYLLPSILLFALNLPIIFCVLPSDIIRLRANILQNYDNHTRPKQNNTDTVTIGMYFNFQGLFFDEQKGLLTLYMLSSFNWKDDHVVWDPLDFGNLSIVTFEATELWKPDIVVLNNYDQSEINHFGNVPILAESDSNIWWFPPTKFQVGCKTDFRLWPHDRQKCKILLASWSYHGGEVDLRLDYNITEVMMDYMNASESREWKIVENSLQRSSRIVFCCPEIPIVDASISLVLERRSTSHVAAVAVVGWGIAVGMLISFWLNPFENERIPITLMIMIINALYLQYLHQIIPNNGTSVPLAVCFFRDSLIMVTFAFGWVVLIRYLRKLKRNTPVPLPAFVETFLSSFVATALCLSPRPESKGQTGESEGVGGNGDVQELVDENSDDSHQEDWEWLARLLDRLGFIAYFITYTVFIFAFL